MLALTYDDYLIGHLYFLTRWSTALAILDYNTIASADKFGNIAIVRGGGGNGGGDVVGVFFFFAGAVAI